MKKFLWIGAILMVAYFSFEYFYFYKGSLYLPQHEAPVYHSKAEGEQLYLNQGKGFEVFDIKGVNLGLGKPGHYATEYAITKEEYLRWFQEIQDMGANVIRTYILAHKAFYEAFYEYNLHNPHPLYLIQGVWVDDYLINSSYSALDKAFYQQFVDDCMAMVDAMHGRYKVRSSKGVFPQYYDKDVSPWVYGYILGIEWENNLVAYTDQSFAPQPPYQGKYFYTENASNFEIFLAGVGEVVAAYETQKYGEQRLIAFSNWATTDPFNYPAGIKDYFKKVATIDVEHIKCTEHFAPGQFASYHIYPYYPDYYSFLPVHDDNTYRQYIQALNRHHTIPVVISEFGVSASRGMAAYEEGLGRNQGFMSETQQGEALVSMYQDIMGAGSAGGIVFTWQDEWFKRTWNTMASVDLEATPYWSDYQTNEQYFGLLSFDPGEHESICYVDGNKSDWKETDVVAKQDGYTLSVKYDEKFIYFLAEKNGFDMGVNRLYIPIDTTPKSGAKRAENLKLSMSEPSDFVIEINGTEQSRLWVQERYDMIRALNIDKISSKKHFKDDFPQKDSGAFNYILLMLQKDTFYKKNSAHSKGSLDDERLPFHKYDPRNELHYSIMETYETGKLLYGNANPKSTDFNSLADICAGVGFVEVKLPWQLLNFANPSHMKIHDDYYECYGVEYLSINFMNVGIGDGSKTIQMVPFELHKLGKKPIYHERLKESYYILQAHWLKDMTS